MCNRARACDTIPGVALPKPTEILNGVVLDRPLAGPPLVGAPHAHDPVYLFLLVANVDYNMNFVSSRCGVDCRNIAEKPPSRGRLFLLNGIMPANRWAAASVPHYSNSHACLTGTIFRLAGVYNLPRRDPGPHRWHLPRGIVEESAAAQHWVV